MQSKTLSIGFIILSSELNSGRLKSTRNSIWNHYGEKIPMTCVVPKNAPAGEVKVAKELCSVHKGGETITSLINAGFKHGHKEWNIIVIEGTWVRGNIDKKYSYFLQDEQDIFFPVVTDYDIQGKPSKIYNQFWECSLNGVMIHNKTFKQVGDFIDGESLELSRLGWTEQAISLGCRFKAVLGAKLC